MRRRDQHHTAVAVALPTIQICAARCLTIRAGIVSAGQTSVKIITETDVFLMLMFMVPQVRDAHLGFMPAVRRHCRPAELNRQHYEKNDNENKAHRRQFTLL